MVSVKKFYAEWCGPCKVLTPVMENVKSKFAQVQFESVDIDSQFEVAQKYYVRSVPTVIIEKDGKASQRLIAQNSGLSIGKVNYCLKALVDIGFLKIRNFNNSNKKLNYAYILTPKGIQQKTAITNQFIIKKKQEYDKLNSYIN